MLRFLLGGAKTGKSRWIADKIRFLAGEEGRRILLLVPEQFTFETEKTLFRELGGETFRRVNVTSFSRLATEIFKQFGGLAGQYADDCAKAVVMEMAISQLRDALSVYQKSSRSKGFAAAMLDTVSEFKNAGVSPEELDRCAESLPEGSLRDKMRETALLYETYNALLLDTYLDPLDDVSRAAFIIKKTDFFEGTTVFLDEFKGFTAAELNFVKLILRGAEDVFVSLCLDMRRAQGSRLSLFSSLLEVYNRLVRYTREAGAAVGVNIHLEEAHFRSPELLHLEQNLFSPLPESYPGECRAVRAVLCKNEYEEVDYALSMIAGLVQEEGYRYSDIAVISRDLDTYLPKLEAGFRKYGLPYYSDKEAPIENKPLIRFVRNLLACGVKGLSAENVLSVLKCDLTPFSVEEVSEFENYVYVWNIGAGQWEDEFTGSPQGFREELSDEDREALQRINRVREFVARRLSPFRKRLREATGREICAAIAAFLENAGVKDKLENLIEGLYAGGDFELSQEYGRLWDILMDILDTIAAAAGDRPVRPENFLSLYELAVSSSGMGVLPQAVDTVTVGAADRIRIGEKRAVFVLGVNENILPYTPTGGGVFTDRERELLLHLDINIAKPSKEKIKEERFIAYKTLCSPSERLWLTARKADISGEVKAPSVLFSEIARMFGENAVLDAEELSPDQYCRSGDAAFSVLAGQYLDDTVLTATLKEVLSKEEGYSDRLSGFERVLENRSFSIEERRNAIALFGKEMKLSPTRVESFYQCHFRYFLEQGIRAFPLKRADLDPLETGTLIHRVLNAVTQKANLRDGYDPQAVKVIIKEELDAYIATVMGGVRDKSSRFLYLYNRLRLSILKIVEQLHAELSQSLFEPCAFEYEISDDADVTPLRLYGEEGTIVNVSGKIDRVDYFTNSRGEKYIRIVDYKSGKKTFKLNDVLYGLNLQMLIYLQCISQNGRGEYENCLPAGILYMPAGEQAPSLPRDAGEEEIQKQKRKGYLMNGLLVEDREVLSAMDTSMAGIFIPVSMKKDGAFSEMSKRSLVTLQELSKINTYIDRLILNMAKELRQGSVEAVPVEGSCEYCNYRAVCGVTKASSVRRYVEHNREEILKEMGENDGEA